MQQNNVASSFLSPVRQPVATNMSFPSLFVIFSRGCRNNLIAFLHECLTGCPDGHTFASEILNNKSQTNNKKKL